MVYIRIKQNRRLTEYRNFLKKFNSKNTNKMDYLIAYRRILSINRSYNRLVCEIYEYNTIISRYLDVTFCIEVLCISYQTYVIFIAKMDTFERYLVANIYFSNLLLLSVLIAACSSINSSNCKMGKISVELIQKLNDSNRFNRYQLDKVILENNIFFGLS